VICHYNSKNSLKNNKLQKMQKNPNYFRMAHFVQLINRMYLKWEKEEEEEAKRKVMVRHVSLSLIILRSDSSLKIKKSKRLHLKDKIVRKGLQRVSRTKVVKNGL
jgi:hypothetical protein